MTVDALAAVAAATDPRLLVCQARSARDAEAFNGAFRALAARHEQRYQMLVERARLSGDIAATLPFLCFDGLALLRVAEASGLELNDGYPLIPSIAHADFTASFSGPDSSTLNGWVG